MLIEDRAEYIDAIIVKFKFNDKEFYYVSDDAHGHWIETDAGNRDAFNELKNRIERIFDSVVARPMSSGVPAGLE